MDEKKEVGVTQNFGFNLNNYEGFQLLRFDQQKCIFPTVTLMMINIYPACRLVHLKK